MKKKIEINIQPVPPLPSEVIEAKENHTLVLFIGAGVSRIDGCESWDSLSHRLLDKCYSQEIINYKEYKRLELYGAKELLTIVKGLLENAGKQNTFYSEFKRSLSGNDKKGIYKELRTIGDLFLTTNADTVFDQYFQSDNIITKIDGNTKPEEQHLYHIHGVLQEKDSLIFTADQYINKYKDEGYRVFLNKIFNNYTVVFIGYGLSEFEILDFLMEKTHKVCSCFLLKEYYADEIHIAEYETLYYNNLGITVIPYAYDEKGYNQLVELIEHWDISLVSFTNGIDQVHDIIDTSLGSDNIAEKKLKDIINEVILRDLYEEYFVDSLIRNSNKLSMCLPILEEKKFFETTKSYVLRLLECVLQKIDDISFYDQNKTILVKIISELCNQKSIVDYQNDYFDTVICRLIFKLHDAEIKSEFLVFFSKYVHLERHTCLDIDLEKIILPCLNWKNEENIKIIATNLFDVNIDIKADYHRCKPLFENFERNYLCVLVKAFFAKLKIQFISILRDKIDICIKNDNSLLSYENYGSVFEGALTFYSELGYPASLMRAYTWMISQLDAEYCIKVCKENFTHNNKYYSMVFLAVLSHKYSELKTIFWKNFDILFVPNNIYELEYLLSINNSLFDKDEIKKIRTTISTFASVSDQKKLLEALISNKPILKRKFYSETWSGETSPYSLESLKKMDINDIVKKIIEFKPDKNNYKAPTEDAFAMSLGDIVKYRTQEISNNISLFYNVKGIYIYNILRGLTDSLELNASWNINAVIKFMEEHYLYSKNKTKESSENKCDYVINEYISLLQHYIDKYKNTIDTTVYEKIKEHDLYILNNQNNEDSCQRDYLMHSYNSLNGQASLLFYSLASIYGTNKKNENDKWDNELKQTLNYLLNKQSKIDFFTVTGANLPLLYYLDKKFAIELIKSLFPDKKDFFFASMSGYFNNNVLYLDIYNDLKGNVYYRASSYEDLPDDCRQRMVDFACLSFLLGNEEYNSSLLKRIIDTRKIKDIERICLYISSIDKNNFFTDKEDRVSYLFNIVSDVLKETTKSAKDKQNYEDAMEYLIEWVKVFKVYTDDKRNIVNWLIDNIQNKHPNYYTLLDGLKVLFVDDKNKENDDTVNNLVHILS
jgi:hypothetical protein